MTRVLEPDSDHLHALPDTHRYLVNSLAACSVCRKWLYLDTSYDRQFGCFVREWKPVRWYHWRFLRRINRYVTEEMRERRNR